MPVDCASTLCSQYICSHCTDLISTSK